MILPVKKIVEEFYSNILNFIYKPLTITAVHCKYTVSNKATPPTVCLVPAVGTNECIAMGSTHKCMEDYQELLLINLK